MMSKKSRSQRKVKNIILLCFYDPLGLRLILIVTKIGTEVERYHNCINRSSHQRCSIKKGVLRNFTKLIGKHLCQGQLYLKTILWHKCFPVNFPKFLRTPILKNNCERLLLYKCNSQILTRF